MMLRKSLMKGICIGFGAILMTLPAHAGGPVALNSSCTLEDKDGQEVQGTNAQVKYPIASVSKVFTSFWAVSRFGADFRYATRIFVTPVDAQKQIVDVHIGGTYDPYFDKDRLQFIVSELNKLGIRSVRNLTYDERFAFAQAINQKTVRKGKRRYSVTRVLDITDNDFAWSTILPSDPTTDSVMNSLRLALQNISVDYTKLRANTTAADIHMVSVPSLKVSDIHFVSEEDYRPAAQTRMFYTRSAPMHVLLKEMNSQSNNWAAEMMFKSLGGAQDFAPFIEKELGLDNKDITFVNGSGNRIDPMGPGKYNQATCEAVVKVLAALDNKMEAAKMNLTDVMAVAGEYTAGTMNTVGSYSNEATSHALIAKTGSINPAIALAGLASTNDGEVYFAYNYGTSGKGQWSPARAKIRLNVNQLFKEHARKKVIDNIIPQKTFLSFDQKSKLLEAEVFLIKTGKG